MPSDIFLMNRKIQLLKGTDIFNCHIRKNSFSDLFFGSCISYQKRKFIHMIKIWFLTSQCYSVLKYDYQAVYLNLLFLKLVSICYNIQIIYLAFCSCMYYIKKKVLLFCKTKDYFSFRVRDTSFHKNKGITFINL